MKRILILVGIVILLLLLLGSAVWWFLTGKPSGPVTAADLVPASSSTFLWLPNVPRSLERFKGTPAYKMWQEQAVQTAWNKLNPLTNPEGKIPVSEEAKKLLDLTGSLWGNFKGEAFLAVTSFTVDGETRGEGIGGFQIGPDPAAFQAWVTSIKTSYPELKWEEKSYPAQSYYITQAGKGSTKLVICAAQWKDWVFVGVGETGFKQLLDRAHAGKTDPALLLTSQASYQELLAGQAPGFDTLIYINPAPFVDAAKKALEKTPEQLATLKPYEAMKGIILTSSIEGQNFRDRWGMQMPKAQRSDYGAAEMPLKGTTAHFTTAQTLFYSAQNIDPPKYLAQMRASGPDQTKIIEGGIAKVNQALAGIPLDFEKDIAPKIGPEVALILEWGPGKPFPDLSLAIEHKDQAVVRKLADFLVQMAQSMGAGQIQVKSGDIAGDPTYTFIAPIVPVTPAIWVGKDMFLLTLNGMKLDTMVKQTGSGLLDSEPYKALAGKSEIKKPISLIYADSEQLLLYSHGALSNLMPMVAGMTGQPDLAQGLPPVDYLKPYLGRWVFMSDMDDKGVRAEGIYEKGHPLIYLVTGIALGADLAKKLATIGANMAAKTDAPAPGNPPEAVSDAVDPALIMADLLELDEAVSTWATENKKPEGTVISWNEVVSFLPENSQVATRVGLDPLGNAYVLGKTGKGQVTLSPVTLEHFGSTLPKNYWGKFTNPSEAPTPGTLPAP